MNLRFTAAVAILIVAGLSSAVAGSPVRQGPGSASAAYGLPIPAPAAASGVDVRQGQKDISLAEEDPASAHPVAGGPAPAEPGGSLTFLEPNQDLTKWEADRSLRESGQASTDTDPSFGYIVAGGDTGNFRPDGTQGNPQLAPAASIACDPSNSPTATATFRAKVSVTNHTLSEDAELYLKVTFSREIYEWSRERLSAKFSLEQGETREEPGKFRSLLPGEGYAMECELRRHVTGPLFFIGWPDESVATDRNTFSVGDFQSEKQTKSVAKITNCSASPGNLQVGDTVTLQLKAMRKKDIALIAASFIQIARDAKLVDSYPSVGSFFPYKKNERRENERLVSSLIPGGLTDNTELIKYTFTPSEPGLYTAYCFLHTGAVKGFTAKTRDENLTLNDYYKVLSLFLPGGGPPIDFWSIILSGYFSHLESVKAVHFCVGDAEDCKFYSTSDDESSGAPDLEIESLTVNKSAMGPGETFTLTATVVNSGSGDSSETTLHYHRSTTSTFSTSVTEDPVNDVIGLDPSDTERVSHPLTAPPDPGLYYYRICVAPASGESDTNNNCSTGVRVTVESPQQGSPDLVVDSPSVSKSETQPGGRFTLRATVRNIGDGRAGSAILRYYRSTDSSISAGSDTEVGSDTVNSLQPSETDPESAPVSAPAAPGQYYYGACVVPVPSESNTGNNCSPSRAVTVAQATTSPDLVVDSPSVNQNEVDAGGGFTLSTAVRNRGDGPAPTTILRYYRSSDSTITTGDAEVETDRVRYLDPSETGDESERLTAPEDAGGYYYGACVDSVTGETDTNNNCSSGVRVTVIVRPPAATDRAALAALYNATDGDRWNDNTNWLSSAPIGQWYGVMTDSDGRVTSLKLHENDLSGTLPPELGDLTELTCLSLWGNSLTGAIPAELGDLANLAQLDLLGNRLDGSIPSSLGDLANLTRLHLAENDLSGTIPSSLGNLTNLESLYLFRNDLRGTIPTSLGNLTNLDWLYMSENGLTGCVPAGLRDAPHHDLDKLRLEYCAQRSTSGGMETGIPTVTK